MVEAPPSDDAAESSSVTTNSHNCAEEGSEEIRGGEEMWVCSQCSETYLDREVAFTLSLDEDFQSGSGMTNNTA